MYDGQLITCEKDLHDAITEFPEMTVELINDFDVPWIEFRGKSYPKYRKTLKLRAEGGSRDGDAEDVGQ